MSSGSRRWEAVRAWLPSPRNRYGLLLAVVGPVLGVAGVIPVAAGVALAVPLYAIGALVAPPRREAELASGVGSADVRRSLDAVKVRVRGHVSGDVESRVRHLSTSITDVLPRAQSLPPGSKARFVLAKTATDYLPSALEPYLDLPRAYAEQAVVVDGKTPAMLLCEQLDVLAAEVDRVVDTIHRADAERVMTNSRFLGDRFGPGALGLDAGDR